jgi:ECF transporter S component (folate family)
MLIAVEVVLTRFFSISTPIVRIGFGFLPVSLAGMLYGPLWAGCAAAMGDVIGALLFPAGAFFPGFTLTAFLTGFTYGALLWRRRDWSRIILSVAIISLLLNLCLDTFWLRMITGKGYAGLLPARIIKSLILAPVQVVTIRAASSRQFWLTEKAKT